MQQRRCLCAAFFDVGIVLLAGPETGVAWLEKAVLAGRMRLAVGQGFSDWLGQGPWLAERIGGLACLAIWRALRAGLDACGLLSLACCIFCHLDRRASELRQ